MYDEPHGDPDELIETCWPLHWRVRPRPVLEPPQLRFGFTYAFASRLRAISSNGLLR